MRYLILLILLFLVTLTCGIMQNIEKLNQCLREGYEVKLILNGEEISW